MLSIRNSIKDDLSDLSLKKGAGSGSGSVSQRNGTVTWSLRMLSLMLSERSAFLTSPITNSYDRPG
jgi:hypothetical protein